MKYTWAAPLRGCVIMYCAYLNVYLSSTTLFTKASDRTVLALNYKKNNFWKFLSSDSTPFGLNIQNRNRYSTFLQDFIVRSQTHCWPVSNSHFFLYHVFLILILWSWSENLQGGSIWFTWSTMGIHIVLCTIKSSLVTIETDFKRRGSCLQLHFLHHYQY